MAKKKVLDELSVTGGSFFDLVSKIDKNAEIIAESAYSNIPDWISTGNYILNACISGSIFGGVPSARVSTLCGTEGVGKSYLACSIVREAQKKGYDAIYIDSEGAIDAKFVSRLGVDPAKLIIKQVSTISETSNFLANILKTVEDEYTKTGFKRKVIYVLDSLGNLTSDKEKDDILSGNQKRDMTKQQEIKAMFRVIATPLARTGGCLIVNSHVYACCTKDTEILMSDGSYKFINDINKGDYVMTCNGAEVVNDTFKYPAPKEIYELEFSDGYKIKCTEGHKFLCNINGKLVYKTASEINESDDIIQI